MSNKRRITKLEQLPEEILTEIMSRVAKQSRSQLCNAMEASRKLAKAAKNEKVYKSINLRPLAVHPLAAKRRYKDLMAKTLAHGNAEAHYIKGILEYLHRDNIDVGLQHLKEAADGSYTDSIYLYGIIMLCRGQMEEGKTYLDKLEWQQSMEIGDRCWQNIKRSLHGVRVRRLPIYMETIVAMSAIIMCNINEMENRCQHCYYYKQMTKFVFVI